MKTTSKFLSVCLIACGAASAPGFADDTQDRLRALQTASIADSHLYLPQQPVAGCPDNRKDRTNTAPLSQELKAAIEEAKKYSNGQKGRALLVMLDGQIVHESYENGTTEETRFVSHSMHKSLVGMAIQTAISDGILPSYEAKLGMIIPALADDPKKDISLSDIMSMEGGLKLYSMGTSGKEAMELNFGADINAATLKLPVVEAPETSFSYNNSSTQLAGIALAQAIESASGEDYATYLHDQIWCPLGNSEASLWLDSEGGSPRYFAGFHATVRDWAEVGEALRLGLPDGTKFDALLEPAATNPNYGKFIWLGAPKDGMRRYSADNPLFVPHSNSYAIPDMVFFDGFGGQRVYVSQEAGLVIVRFGEVSFQYDDAIIPNLILNALDK